MFRSRGAWSGYIRKPDFTNPFIEERSPQRCAFSSSRQIRPYSRHLHRAEKSSHIDENSRRRRRPDIAHTSCENESRVFRVMKSGSVSNPITPRSKNTSQRWIICPHPGVLPSSDCWVVRGESSIMYERHKMHHKCIRQSDAIRFTTKS